MPEFRFRGRITQAGVIFYLSAPDRESAIAAAKCHSFDEFNADGAETVNWDIDPTTIEENS
jgi:hypothetical protein